MSVPTPPLRPQGPTKGGSAPAAATGKRSHWRFLSLALLLVLVLPPLQCALLRWVDPPVTETMLVRTLSRGWHTGVWSRPAYQWTDWADLPRHLPASAISSEDRGFFAHRGFDLVAIRRAWHRHQTRPEAKLVGGSTISQQVARNVFLWQHRSWLRKGLEAYYTLWMELLVPKQRILEVYLNIAELGPMVFGVEAAAHHWFGKPARRLSRGEGALLVAMLPAPNSWTPRTPHVQRRAAWIQRAGVRLPRSVLVSDNR